MWQLYSVDLVHFSYSVFGKKWKTHAHNVPLNVTFSASTLTSSVCV